MKAIKPIFFLMILTLLFSSCRSEDEEIIDPPVENNLIANSNIANLMSRTSLNDGSADNIIDSANCLSVQLPVTVTVNGIEITINNENGYQEIEDIIDLFDDDIDSIVISYPITVILPDFSTVVINSDTELANLAATCNGENEDDDDIECIDFQYPITASIFNTNNELINTITINNDNELHDFLEDIDQFDIVTLNFPITVILSDGTTLQINDLQDLENTIESFEDSCDEDDDNDFDDDDCDSCTTDDLDSVFADCSEWTVDKLERNDNDLEDNYVGYVFGFNSDGTISVTQGANMFSGTWSASGSGNNITVTIDIPALTDFNDTWNLHEIEQEPGDVDVDLRKGDDRLRFESDCGSNGGGNDLLSDTLTAQNSVWIVSSYLDDGVDETNDFNGYEFTFESSGTVNASNGGSTVMGNWASQDNATELVLNFGANIPLDELNDDWDVVSISDTQIELVDVSGGGGGTIMGSF